MSNASRTQRFAVSADSESDTKTSVSTRGFEFLVDEPDALGGTDDGPNPVEYLLGAWAGCLNVVGHTVAEEYGFDLHDLRIDLEGELDPGRFLGETDAVRAGYQRIDVTVAVEADADEAVLREWLSEVESRCPVGDNVQHSTPATLSLEH